MKSGKSRARTGKCADNRRISSEIREIGAWIAKYGEKEQLIIKSRLEARRQDQRRYAEYNKNALPWEKRPLDLYILPLEIIRALLRHTDPIPRGSLEHVPFHLAGEICIPLLEIALTLLVEGTTRAIDAIRHRIKRPIYYTAENARRRALAAERRKIARRSTTSPIPTPEEVLEAWKHRRESHESAIRFGSMIHDLECHLDNSLRFDQNGEISGRNGGIKRWLEDNLPELFKRYTTVMRYKAAAKKLRQLTEIKDPVPAARILDDSDDPPAEIVRARAIWNEITLRTNFDVTALFNRIDALLDPERIEETTMLETWKRKYADEITERTKNRWWRKFLGKNRKAAKDGETRENEKIARTGGDLRIRSS